MKNLENLCIKENKETKSIPLALSFNKSLELVKILQFSGVRGLLIDIGKYIIADMILNEQKEKEFKAQIEEGILSIEEVEKEFLGFSSSYVTAQIFKHWKLSPNLINSIEFVDDINSVSKEFERKAKILSVIKTVANIKEPLSEKSIKEGIIKAKEYGFDTKILSQTIANLKKKIN